MEACEAEKETTNIDFYMQKKYTTTIKYLKDAC